jgi:protein arginine N-methyltransferase 1
MLEAHIPSLVDARRRHLAAGGKLVPTFDVLRASLVEIPEKYDRLEAPWRRERFGFDMSAARAICTNSWERADFKTDQLLAEPASWGRLDYHTIESSDVAGTVDLTVTRAGVVHGLGVWFDTELWAGIGFSNAPGCPDTVYGRAFFPLEEPLPVAVGDQVQVHLRADLVGAEYVYSWTTEVVCSARESARARLSQSTFYGNAIPLERIRKRAAGFQPRRNRDAEVDAAVLTAMTGQQSVRAIAAAVATRFPDRFKTSADAFAYVAGLSERYSE